MDDLAYFIIFLIYVIFIGVLAFMGAIFEL